MAHVTVKINGFSYAVACEDGQEAHLQAMAEQVERRITSIRAVGQTNETRLLVLAALLMADELHDLESELRDLTTETNSLRDAARAGARRPALGKPDPDLADRLEKLADRAEEIANQLEQS